MNDANIQGTRDLSATARAEAAAWIARLHGPQRSPELEAGLRRWLAESPENARVFERVTEAWEAATAASAGHFPRLTAWNRSAASRALARAAVILLICGILGFGAYAWWSDPSYITTVGEQRSVRLEDGSRISLNSASRVVVHYSADKRRVRLERGEAYFEVAPNADRPFVVTAGGREVTALGTSFSVRYESGRLAVVLVEGKVTVSALEEPAPGQPDEPQSADEPTLAAVTLSPGQRLIVAATSLPRLDMPPVEAVTAWRRGEVVLDKTPLADAVAEMNRYDETRLVIDDAGVSDLLVSGIYRTGDSAGFARAVARMHDLTIEQDGNRIRLREATQSVSQ